MFDRRGKGWKRREMLEKGRKGFHGLEKIGVVGGDCRSLSVFKKRAGVERSSMKVREGKKNDEKENSMRKSGGGKNQRRGIGEGEWNA